MSPAECATGGELLLAVVTDEEENQLRMFSSRFGAGTAMGAAAGAASPWLDAGESSGRPNCWNAFACWDADEVEVMAVWLLLLWPLLVVWCWWWLMFSALSPTSSSSSTSSGSPGAAHGKRKRGGNGRNKRNQNQIKPNGRNGMGRASGFGLYSMRH